MWNSILIIKYWLIQQFHNYWPWILLNGPRLEVLWFLVDHHILLLIFYRIMTLFSSTSIFGIITLLNQWYLWKLLISISLREFRNDRGFLFSGRQCCPISSDFIEFSWVKTWNQSASQKDYWQLSILNNWYLCLLEFCMVTYVQWIKGLNTQSE